MKKRILSLLLALVMLLGLLPTAALAANEPFTVTISMEGLTLGQGFYLEPRTYTLDQINKLTRGAPLIGDTVFTEDNIVAAAALIAMLNEENIAYHTTGAALSGFYLSEAEGLDTGEVNVPQVIVEGSGLSADDLTADGNDDEWLGEFDYSNMSGWMITVNNFMITRGAGDWPINSGDVIRWQFTLYGYGADLGHSTGWGNEAYFASANKDALYKAYAASTNQKAKQVALPIMEKLDATQAEVDEALAALMAASTPDKPTATNYLTDAKFFENYFAGSLSSPYSMTSAFTPSTHEYTIIVPDYKSSVYPQLTFAADAPEGLTATFTYTNKRGQETKVTYNAADLENSSLLSLLMGNNYTSNSATLTLANGSDEQTYTFHFKRKPTLSELSLQNTADWASDTTVYGVTDLGRETYTGYEVSIPYEGAYITWSHGYTDPCTVKVNGTEFTKDSKLDATTLWQGEAGSRHFDLTFTLKSENPETVETTYTVTCRELAALTITQNPTKMDYLLGDTFDPTGMVVQVKYGGQDAQTIPLDDLTFDPATISSIDNETPTADVTVHYGDLSATLTVNVEPLTLTGSGTEEDPYLLATATDLTKLSKLVAAGNAYAGKYFKITNDITLPANWTPIGGPKAGKTWTPTISQRDMNPFSGYVDGAKADGSGCYTITVPEGSKTMIGALAGGKLSNLNIYGKKIDGYGVVEYYYVDRSNPVKAEIDNVTLKSGSHTKYSGFIGGYASGVDVVLIRNCTVEAGVIIGDDGTIPEWAEELNAAFPYPWGPTGLQYRDAIGSFGGMLNGTIENCVSHAKVYGRKFVGGILGFKGQSMGDCIVRNCVFDGEVHATGSFAGGITGGGYSATSAPNTPAASVENCVVTGSVTGATYVGGIFGGEELLMQCWENGIGYVRGNYFNGTVTATAEDGVKGGIIGYMNALNRYNVVSNNYFLKGSADKGIGSVNFVETPDASGSVGSGWNKVTFNGARFGRDDDPTGAGADKLAAPFEASALTDGTLTGSLNAAVTGKAWTQGASAPVLSTAKRVVRLTSTQLNTSGGVRFWQDTGIGNLNGKKVTVTYSDGTTEEIDASKCALSGIDFTKTGYQLGTITYKGYQLFFGVNVTSGGTAPTDTKAVTVSVLGDSIHDVTTDSVHTLAQGNLTPWLTDVTVVMDTDATALDAFAAACDAYGLSYVATDSSYGGKYITSVTSASGVTLTDKSNKQSDGKSYSGWMYTVDGTSSMVSIDQAAVNSSLVVYFEDDYNLAYVQSVIDAIDALPTPATEEAVKAIEDQMQWFSPVARASVTNLAKLTAAREALEAAKAAANVVDLINAIPAEITKDSGAAIKAARDAYNALNDAAKELVPADKLKKLTDAEAKYADLTKPVTPVTPSAPAQLPQNPSAGETLPFADVNANSWYYSGVKFAYEKGLMNGTGNGTFSPNADTTRGMIVTMLARLEGQNTSGTPWYAASQKWAMDNGISDGTNMTGAITREQFAAILYRYAKQKGYDISKSADLNGFADANTVSAYATDAMRWAVASGLIQGSNSKLNPKGSATRAQVATILMRFMELYAK